MKAQEIIRRIQLVTGLSQSTLARLADVSPSTVSRISRGEIDPTWGTLQSLLSASGMAIVRGRVLPAGDLEAIPAARAVLENRTPTPSFWADAMKRANWTLTAMTTEDLVNMGNVVGNAGKFGYRARPPLTVALPVSMTWQELARSLGEAGVEYAASGLVATSPDRVLATASSPIIYVADPETVAARFGLSRAGAMRGLMLSVPVADELRGTDEEGGIVFVSRAQALLDAFAVGGRQTDKAEDLARTLRLAA